jgi:hypothetical protein
MQANDAETILTTGKYLNAVRECGKTVVCPWLDSIEYDPAKRTHVECIEAAYRFASKVTSRASAGSRAIVLTGVGRSIWVAAVMG